MDPIFSFKKESVSRDMVGSAKALQIHTQSEYIHFDKLTEYTVGENRQQDDDNEAASTAQRRGGW